MTSKANKHQNITQIKHIKQYEYSSKTRQKKKRKKIPQQQKIEWEIESRASRVSNLEETLD